MEYPKNNTPWKEHKSFQYGVFLICIVKRVFLKKNVDKFCIVFYHSNLVILYKSTYNSG